LSKDISTRNKVIEEIEHQLSESHKWKDKFISSYEPLILNNIMNTINSNSHNRTQQEIEITKLKEGFRNALEYWLYLDYSSRVRKDTIRHNFP